MLNAAERPTHFLSDDLGKLLRDANRAFTRTLQRRIAVHGVSIGHWWFLSVLWQQDGLTQRELSDRVGMMEPTTMTAIRGMETLGMVARIPNPKDRRKVNVYLTDRGRALQDVLRPCAEAALRQATARLEAETIGQLILGLGILTASLMADGEVGDGRLDELDRAD